jgi:hypothetical protein
MFHAAAPKGSLRNSFECWHRNNDNVFVEFIKDNILIKKKFPKVIKFLIFILQVKARKPFSYLLDGTNFGEGK